MSSGLIAFSIAVDLNSTLLDYFHLKKLIHPIYLGFRNNVCT